MPSAKRMSRPRRREESRKHRAYQVQVQNRKITFIDTPATKRYLDARASAKVTDVVVLVVAADDGVMPQHWKPLTTPSGKVPIVVPSTRLTSRRPARTGEETAGRP